MADSIVNQVVVMSVLAVIGGVDSRPRLGGVVTHDEFGQGTVAKIAPNGRVTVQFHETGEKKICRLNDITAVSQNTL